MKGRKRLHTLKSTLITFSTNFQCSLKHCLDTVLTQQKTLLCTSSFVKILTENSKTIINTHTELALGTEKDLNYSEQ